MGTVRTVLKDLYGELDAFGRFWLYIGLGTLLAAAAMSWSFGSAVSMKHAIFLCLLSIITAFAPMAAERLWQKGRRNVSLAVALFSAPLFVIEFYSHAGYTAGLRGQNVGTARVQNATYTQAQDAITEDKAALAKARSDLELLRKTNPWAATVTADALRADLPAIEEAITQEARRVRCGTKCLALKEKKAAIEAKIAIAEEANGTALRIAELEKRLASRRDTGKKTAYAQSAVVEQNLFLAKAIALVRDGSLQPDAKLEEGAQQSVNLAMAVAGTGLPAFALFLAGLFRREDTEPEAPARRETTALVIPKTASETWAAALHRRCAARSVSPPKLITA